ncbi:fimbrial protein, partial [Aeromonas sanarellii]|uniref:fimbrial protein n=1 Tax=Aeromonas sanarellii TaxID=633415 RepID=UPI0039A25C05
TANSKQQTANSKQQTANSKQHLIMKNFFVLFLFFFSHDAISACTINAPYSINVPLTIGRISAGNDIPNGSVIMKQRIMGLRSIGVSCNSSVIIKFDLLGGELYPTKINVVAYKTGIQGLGVRFRQSYTNEFLPSSVTHVASFSYNPQHFLSFYLEFIKLGEITSGTIDASILPQIKITHSETGSAYQYNIATYNFVGTSQIEVPTCTTPDFTRWDLGSVDVNHLKIKGHAQWKDTPIILTNCSTFYGNNANGSYTLYEASSNGSYLQGTLNNNALFAKLSPMTEAIDWTNGILSLDAKSTASGVGIQLGSKQTGSYQPLNLLDKMQITPSIGYNGGTITFPLSARIIKTHDTLTMPGKVSASVIYTITYQ